MAQLSALRPDRRAVHGPGILNADLRPWNYRSHACGDAKGDIVVRRITSTWSVNSLSWSQQPTVTTSGQGVKGSAVGDHCSGDLTSRDVYYTIEDIVRDWSNGQPNYGLRISALQEGGVINWREFRSANYTDSDGHPPHLYVKYHVPTEPKTTSIFMPYMENPTVGDAIDNNFASEELPTSPQMTRRRTYWRQGRLHGLCPGGFGPGDPFTRGHDHRGVAGGHWRRTNAWAGSVTRTRPGHGSANCERHTARQQSAGGADRYADSSLVR